MNHFKDSEFECCGCGLDVKNMSTYLLKMLDTARDIAEVPFIINSSIRCKKHNAIVGGSKLSSHLTGKAVDIKCDDSITRFKILQTLLKLGFTRIGLGSNFLHVDCDESKDQKVIWNYK